MNLSDRREGDSMLYLTACAGAPLPEIVVSNRCGLRGVVYLAAQFGALMIAVVTPAVYADEPTVETILTGLQTPRSVAIRPTEIIDHDEVFVAESGAGQIIRVHSTEPAESTVAITGFSADPPTESSASPLALLFVDSDQLVVGCGSPPAVRAYKLTDVDQPLKADMPSQHLGGENVLSVVAISRTRANDNVSDMLIVGCRGDDPKIWLASIPVRAGMIDKTNPFAASVRFSDNERPVALTVSPQGFVVVSSRAPNDSQNGLLTFINPIRGSAVMELVVDLADITGLAFSPKSGNLFAIAAQPNSQDSSGLFRIDDASVPGKPGCKAVKIADLSDPAAMAFAPEGTLYVTAIDRSDSGDFKNGTLLRIHGDL
jgi:hypothetical protein